MILECKNAKRYKGIRPPACCGGDPCVACRLKYLERKTLGTEAYLNFHVKSVQRNYARFI